MQDRQLVTSAHVAKELGVATRTVAYWVRMGWLTPTVRTPGGKYRWDMDDVYQQMKELRERSDEN